MMILKKTNLNLKDYYINLYKLSEKLIDLPIIEYYHTLNTEIGRTMQLITPDEIKLGISNTVDESNYVEKMNKYKKINEFLFKSVIVSCAKHHSKIKNDSPFINDMLIEFIKKENKKINKYGVKISLQRFIDNLFGKINNIIGEIYFAKQSIMSSIPKEEQSNNIPWYTYIPNEESLRLMEKNISWSIQSKTSKCHVSDMVYSSGINVFRDGILKCMEYLKTQDTITDYMLADMVITMIKVNK